MLIVPPLIFSAPNETIEPESRQVAVPDGGDVEVNLTVAASPAPK